MARSQKTKEYVLDNKDMKILDIVADNGRLPYLQISRLARISKDRVRERLLRMEREKYIIKYTPFIDYSFLGFKVYHIYVKINPAHNAEKSIQLLRLNPNVISTIFTFGKYDLGIGVLAKSKEDAVDKIRKDIGKVKTCVLTSIEYDVYSMHLTNAQAVKIKKGRYHIDELDITILKELAADGRKSLVDIASSMHTSVEIIRYRLSTMLKQKVIRGFHARIHKNKLGLITYTFLMNVKKDTKVKRIFDRQNIYYGKRCFGKYNYVVSFHAKDTLELASTVKFIRQTLGDDLVSFDLLILMGWTKFDPLPEGFNAFE